MSSDGSLKQRRLNTLQLLSQHFTEDLHRKLGEASGVDLTFYQEELEGHVNGLVEKLNFIGHEDREYEDFMEEDYINDEETMDELEEDFNETEVYYA